ncbi:MAG: hypothetical protein JXP34_13330 [Planctomycetes bacterium]|nr:hypothetical protein [Planctomycetota bacterium]
MDRKVRFLPITLSLISGLGHIWEGRDGRGLVLFVLFALSLFGLLNGLVLIEGPEGRVVAGISAALGLTAWIFGLADIVRLTHEPRVARIRSERAARIREASERFLRDDLAGAERLLRENLRDDPRDPDSLFRLATVLAERGDRRAALRCLGRLRAVDLEGTWKWEAQALRTALRPARCPETVTRGAR